MIDSIEVVPLCDNEETTFSNLRLFHGGCAPHPLTKYRDPLSDTYSLRCQCGSSLALSDNDIMAITYTAIDQQPRSISRTDANPISINARLSQ